MLADFLQSLRPFDEFCARRELMRDGYTMPDSEIVKAHVWLERNRDDLRVRRGRIEHRDGRVIKGKWLVGYLEGLEA